MKLPFSVNHGHHRAPACVSRAGEPSGDGLDVARTSALQHVLAAALSMAVLSSPLSPAVAATDGAAIGKCLLANCQIPLAKCITNPTCLTNLACIQTCTNRQAEPYSGPALVVPQCLGSGRTCSAREDRRLGLDGGRRLGVRLAVRLHPLT